MIYVNLAIDPWFSHARVVRDRSRVRPGESMNPRRFAWLLVALDALPTRAARGRDFRIP